MFFRLRALFATIALALAPALAQAFSIAPGLVDVDAHAGAATSTIITVRNPSDEAHTYYLDAVAFKAQDESGSPVFLPEEKTGIWSWMRFPSPSVFVAAHGKTDVPVSLTVPTGTKPGEYSVAVTVSDAPADIVAAAGGASVQAKIAVLIFVKVDGNGQEKVGLLDTGMKDGWSVRSGLWGVYQFRLQNQGAVHVIPEGTVVARSLFGRVITQGKANESLQRLMPATTRTFDGTLVDEPTSFFDAARTQARFFALGPVTLHFTLTPGLVPNQPLTVDFRLWILPWQLLACVAFVVGILYALLKLLMRPR